MAKNWLISAFGFMFIMGCVLSVTAALPASARSASGSEQGASNSQENGFVCLVRTGSGPGGAPQVTRIKVRANNEQLYSQRGFVRGSCAEANKWLRTAGPSLCALKDVNDAAFLSQFMNTYGVSPREICDLMRGSSAE